MLKQATIAERANAFRQQCELAETIKLKEINLYASSQLLCFSACLNLLLGWPLVNRKHRQVASIKMAGLFKFFSKQRND